MKFITMFTMLFIGMGCKLECKNLPTHTVYVDTIVEKCPEPLPTPESKSACEYEVESLKAEIEYLEKGSLY